MTQIVQVKTICIVRTTEILHEYKTSTASISAAQNSDRDSRFMSKKEAIEPQ